MTLRVLMAVVAICVLPVIAWAQNGPLRIEITEGVVEPMPFAAPNFVPESGAANEFAEHDVHANAVVGEHELCHLKRSLSRHCLPQLIGLLAQQVLRVVIAD